MSQPIVECVPNFSEGRDMARMEKILDAIRAVSGVDLIDVDPGAETNRTVVTLVGAPEPVKEAAFRAIQMAQEVIDMRQHSGAHARHGATDVCPFVPVSGVTMEDCAGFARDLGERVGAELGIPVYLYDEAALRPERRSLADVRRGEYEALPDKLGKPEWAPDFGPAEFLPRTGVITIGAREFLIAYNVNLNSRYKEHATDLAFDIREAGRIVRDRQRTPIYMSGRIRKYQPTEDRWPCAHDDTVCESGEALSIHYREAHGLDLEEELRFFGKTLAEISDGAHVERRGMFGNCRAVGWVIPEYGRAQISINLTNFKNTPAHEVLEACRRIGEERGILVTGSEIVGVVPFQAMSESGDYYLKRAGASRGIPVQDRIETAIQSMGLRDIGKFEAARSVLGMPTIEGELANKTVQEFTHEVSRPSVAPGGGSVAALVGSLGAALAAMVANITHSKARFHSVHEELEASAMRCQSLKDQLLVGIDQDTDAFGEVITAMRLPKSTAEQRALRDKAIQCGYQSATLVPLKTAELCLEALKECRCVVDKCLAASLSDAGVGALVAKAGVYGGAYNVRINLGEISDEGWKGDLVGRVDAMVAEADRLAAEVQDHVDARLDG